MKNLKATGYGYHIDETLKFLRRFVKVDVIKQDGRNRVFVNINGFTMRIEERFTHAYLDVSHEIGCNDFDSVVMQFRWSEA